jgi:CO/xanthine dehydrogenase FAD-binding subunit
LIRNRRQSQLVMKDYEYHLPTSLNEALRLKADYGGAARFVAGGTDVMVMKRAGRLDFGALISLRRVPEIADIRKAGDSIVIGGGVTLTELMQSEIIRRDLPSLYDAVCVMGCTQMRNLATVGGNVMSAVSSGDTIPPLLAMDAHCRLASADGERTVPLADFFPGPRQTKAQEGEVLVSLDIPKPAAGCGMAFHKLGRRAALDLAVVSIAIALELEPGAKVIAKARAAAGAVGPTPIRLHEAEKILSGATPNEEAFTNAAQAALTESSPWDDVRASRWYREEMIRVVFPRVAWAALERADAGGLS